MARGIVLRSLIVNFFVFLFLHSTMVAGISSSGTTLPNPILFVTQVPIPIDTSTITAVFANHLATTRACGRGGDLYILYPDGTIKNLTATAGYGTSGLQGSTAIAVREPAMHWDGTKAIFSMIVGAPTSQSDSTQFYWQLYEVSGLGKLETPVITKVPFQPDQYHNTNPIYGTDERIIFSSDRPFRNLTHLYPQIDEYRGEQTNSGLWSLDPQTGDLNHIDHSPSGDFRPIIDSYGRLIFSRWDHLQRDSQADVDIMDGNKFGSFNFSDESAGAAILENDRTEYFPEPQARRTDLLAGTNVIGFEFNHFIPWQMNEDGSEQETMNHVGRHDLNGGAGRNFNDDPNLVNFVPSPQRTNHNSINNMVQLREDPTTPGRYYGIDCLENGTHGAGQIITLAGAPTLDAQDMFVTYVTPRPTAFFLPENGSPNPNYTGHYRNPLPLSNGTVVAIHAAENRADKNTGTYALPSSRYAFRLTSLKIQSGSILMADTTLTPGVSKTFSYWSDSGLVSYSGTMWELDPVEVVSRVKPVRRIPHVGLQEMQVMAEEGVDSAAFKNYLQQHNLAVIVSRNITNRNTDDHQQPFYLKVHNSSTQSANPSGKIYDVAHLQLVEADYLRGYGLVNGNPTPKPGRRVLATPLNDSTVHNPSNPGGPAGSVQLGSDGSLAAFIPAHRAMSWQLVDSAGTPVVHERFWVTFAPGEVRTCASCHGANGEATVPKQPTPQNKPEAFRTLLQYWKNILNPPSLYQYAVSGTWNMVSLPRLVSDARKTSVYSTATSGAFTFQNGYLQKDTLVPGEGYWVKFATGQNITISGAAFTRESVKVSAGWNMVGALTDPISVVSVASNPPDMTTSSFFGFNGSSYVVADSIRPGAAYWVKVNQPGVLIFASGPSTVGGNHIRITSTGEQPPSPPSQQNGLHTMPQDFALEQNYPNPFNPTTVIRYQVPMTSKVSLKVYDVLGREVATLTDGIQEAGFKSIEWNPHEVATGIYVYRLDARSLAEPAKPYRSERKMLFVK